MAHAILRCLRGRTQACRRDSARRYSTSSAGPTAGAWSSCIMDEPVEEVEAKEIGKAAELTANTYAAEEGERLHACDRSQSPPCA
ncbi:hypothetical protein EVG20_g9902 [Dentipellis fragilis]|uniref:Uncharacterized protein n=1 Tax=Dentipellis fragilis TaxID=205917 RepID=A0A4Y9XX42_9AGAM|nr:hypothetical protein EVG20_g9902 [Dentipellis fragilis]